MKFDLFISDYDGTLGVAPKNDIDPETLVAINKYIEKGGVFAVYRASMKSFSSWARTAWPASFKCNPSVV